MLRKFILLSFLASLVVVPYTIFAQNLDFFELVKKGSPEQVEKLVKKGVKLNEKDMFGITPLMLASSLNKNPKVIDILVNNGADINAKSKDGFTPIMLAVKYNKDPKTIRLLLGNGADVNMKNNEGETVYDYIANNAKLMGTNVLKELERRKIK